MCCVCLSVIQSILDLFLSVGTAIKNVGVVEALAKLIEGLKTNLMSLLTFLGSLRFSTAFLTSLCYCFLRASCKTSVKKEDCYQKSTTYVIAAAALRKVFRKNGSDFLKCVVYSSQELSYSFLWFSLQNSF